ncbi:MAG: hypothetical protein ACODAD_16255 [Planctomycetota bacterium]
MMVIVKLLDETGFSWGYQSRIAERLGVSRATISRDMGRLFRRVWGGKEAEKRHDRQEAMKRGRRREDQLERERLARQATDARAEEITPWDPAPEAESAAPVPASLAPEPAPPAFEPTSPPPLRPPPSPGVPQWVSGVRTGMGDLSPWWQPERRRYRY